MSDEKAATEGAKTIEVNYGPRQAALAWGPLGSVLQFASAVCALGEEVRQAWITGRRHPLAAIGTVKRAVLTPGRPPINRLVGVIVPEGLIEQLARAYEMASVAIAESGNLPIEKDPLEMRTRERIAGALTAFVRYVSAIDPEQQGDVRAALTLALSAFSEENGLKPAPEEAVFNWPLFWPAAEDETSGASDDTIPPSGETNPAGDETMKADPETAAAGGRELARDFDVTGAAAEELKSRLSGADTCGTGGVS